jgi:MoxR-like ATPase
MHATLGPIESELGSTWIDREEVIHSLLLALLTRQHVLLIGPPGTGKTELLKDLCSRVEGADFFHLDMNASKSEDDILGPLDVGLYDREGRWERSVEGYLPSAHLALLDEVGRGSKFGLDALLRIMAERQVRNGSRIIDVPLITLVAGSNDPLRDWPALNDRFLLRHQLGYISDRDVPRLLRSSTRTAGATVTLEALTGAQKAVQDVILTSSVETAIVKIRRELHEAGVMISDRRLRQSVSILQAEAHLNSRTTTSLSDLPVLRHAYWLDPDQYLTVSRIVMKHTGATVDFEVNRALTDIIAGAGQLSRLPASQRQDKAATLAAELESLQGRAGDSSTAIRDRLREAITAVTQALVGASEAI